MIYPETRNLKAGDNSNIQCLKCFHVTKKRKRPARSGHVIKGSVRTALANTRYKKGDIVTALIVGTKKKRCREDGSTIAFSTNLFVVIDAKNEPVGTRVNVPVDRYSVRKFQKISSMANEVY